MSLTLSLATSKRLRTDAAAAAAAEWDAQEEPVDFPRRRVDVRCGYLGLRFLRLVRGIAVTFAIILIALISFPRS